MKYLFIVFIIFSQNLFSCNECIDLLKGYNEELIQAIEKYKNASPARTNFLIGQSFGVKNCISVMQNCIDKEEKVQAILYPQKDDSA